MSLALPSPSFDHVARGFAEAGKRWTAPAERRTDHPTGGYGMADPGLRTALDRLGLGPAATQADIDARYREIVKHERPDLGNMPVSDFIDLREARETLSAHARTRAHASAGRRWDRTIDLRDGSSSVDLRL